MYKIEHIKDNQSDNIKLINTRNNSCAKIVLNDGASLQELCLNNTFIIEDLSPLKYKDTYASSILFPFANRIKDGTYTFNRKNYQFYINQKEENNALHGLVYNKTFKILDKNSSENEASIKLEYNEAKESKGFPYTYTIQLQYTLNENGLKLYVLVKNTDTKPFPFTLGWHPYFISDNLYDSTLTFDSDKKLILNEKMITTGIEDFKNNNNFEVKDKKLDDCFILNTNTIEFKTPSYNLEISASSSETFLQLYTPPKTNTIAIEPTTGVSDSFNNKMGLQVLESGKTYSIDWEIKVTSKK
ncbi:aldose 1-epimerase [uncultured Winogradskyella sp.]|uniref:aldose 1-epimerase n=1 Tax=uncultured Winogradskyella sp. TaxID=395353 RepID=UPI002638CF1B|nr:aldose 1-epimerase [uncultured Winogradskyella sp.]